MELSITQYTFHRLYAEQGASTDDVFSFCKAVGVDYMDILDYDQYWGEDVAAAMERVPDLLGKHGLKLATFGTSTTFTDTEEKRRESIDRARKALEHCRMLGANVMRIFGGHASAEDDLDAMRDRVVGSIKEFIGDAESAGVVLAIENHGGMPGTAGEARQIIEDVGSECLRANVDIGNFLAAGQGALEGTRELAPWAALVHVKDFSILDEPPKPGARAKTGLRPCIIGQGDVPVAECLKALKNAGYDGFLSIEYEGPEPDVRDAIRRSVDFVKSVLP